MVNLLLSGFVFMLLLTGCGWNGTPTRSNDFTPLTSIEITADSATVANGTSTRLTAKGNYAGLFTRDITADVAWSSRAPGVADFVAAMPNRVRGLTPGTAVLTATVGGVSSTLTLLVSDATVTALTITTDNAPLSKGLTRQFAVSATLSDATSQDLTFDAEWLSSAPAVATVSNGPVSKGLVTAIAEGATTLSATFAGASTTRQLIVTSPRLRSITVSPSNPTLLSLSKVVFQAEGTYSDGTKADLTNQAVWSSDNANLATVTAGGVAKTLVPGTVTLSANLADVGGTSRIKITGGILTGITVFPPSQTAVKGTTSRIFATGSFNNLSTRDISGAVEWSVTNAASDTVTTPGGNLALLIPKELTSGTKVIAKSGSVSGEANLRVTVPQLQSISITPTSLDNLIVGTSDQLTVTAFFSDDTSQDVTLSSTWASNGQAIATVGNNGIAKGRVTAETAGLATINAIYGHLNKDVRVTGTVRILQDLTIIPGATTAVIGNPVKFTASASYDGALKDVTAKTIWSVDKPDLAQLVDPVNQPGEIVMVDAGSVTVTASFGNRTKTIILTSQGL